jgi:hypothetical protein
VSGVLHLYLTHGMLPCLPDTDIFQHVPDAEGIALLAEDYTINTVPPGMGVYCLYHPVTGDIVYIGAGCGIDTQGGSNRGLHMRLKLYRQPRGPHDHKIRDAVRTEGLLLKIWLTSTAGDAFKYETDAIRLYQPRLNVVGCRGRTAEEDRIRRKILNQNKTKVRWTYDPEAEKRCGRCKFPKTCKDFRRNAGKKLAVVDTCRECEQNSRRQKAKERRTQALANGLPYTAGRHELGPTQMKIARLLRDAGACTISDICRTLHGHSEVRRRQELSHVLNAMQKKGVATRVAKAWAYDPAGSALVD